MEIFDDFLKKLADAADYTVKEAEKLTSAAKIKFAIIEEQGRIDSALEKLGKLYYKSHGKTQPDAEVAEIDDSNDDDEMEAICQELDTRYEKLEKLNEEQAIFKRYRFCENCKNRIDKDSTFCPKCGMKQDGES